MDVIARIRAAGDDGLATSEYATCTVAATVFGVVLHRILTSDRVRDLLFHVLGSFLHWPG